MAKFTDMIMTLGTPGDDEIGGTAGDDDLRGGQGNDLIYAGAGNDFLRGGAGNDYLAGNIGDDRLEGAGENDSLYGGKGNDSLSGGNGSDILSGDFGADLLLGGTGNDLFYFNSATAGYADPGVFASDTIRDFTAGDQIHFDRYGVNAKLMFAQVGTSTTISVDTNGDGAAEYLAATVLNSAVADVQAATSFGGLLLV